MADADDPRLPARSRPAGLAASLAAAAVLGLVAAGAGLAAGMWLADRAATAPAAPATAEAATVPAWSRRATVIGLDPIVTNLSAPPGTWVRLEASLVVGDPPPADPELLKAAVQDDFLAFLRTLSLGHIAGAMGLLHLREDLAERAALRSGGAVVEVVLRSLVVE